MELLLAEAPGQQDGRRKGVSFAAFAYCGSRTFREHHLRAIQELSDNPLDKALSFDKPVEAGLLLQWVANCKAKEAFARNEGNNEEAKTYARIVATVEERVSEVVGVPTRFQMSLNPLAVKVSQGGEPVELDLLADGLKSILFWVGDLLMRLDRIPWADNTPVLERNFLLLLDEIDIHLHPAWQRQVLPMVQMTFPNAQIIVTTHSPFVVGSVSDAWVIPLLLDQPGKARVGEPTPSKAGSSYRAVLQSVFGIEKEFDVETERQLDEFENLRDRVLREEAPRADLDALSERLTQRGVEVAEVVGFELRQLDRQLKARRAS